MVMWKPLGVDNYVIKFEKLECGFDLFISDFIHIWSSNQNHEETVAVFKNLNPLIEAPPSKLIEKIHLLFENIRSITKHCEIERNTLSLSLNSDFAGIKFIFNVKLTEQNADVLFQKILLPLMIMAARFQYREKKLIEIINKKDNEIDEYKRENIAIKRGHLITDKFIVEEFEKNVSDNSESSVCDVIMRPSMLFDIVNVKMLDLPLVNVLKEENVGQDSLDGNLDSVSEGGCKLKAKNQSGEGKGTKSKKSKSRIEIPFNRYGKREKSKNTLNF